MACPASVLLEDKMPQVTSVYAEEGTEAHELSEAILQGKPYPKHTPEMLEFVTVYTDFVLDETEEGDDFVVEARLDLTHLAPDMFGTLDFGRWRSDTKELLIVDLKYGVGKAVWPKGNPQLMAYASGLIRHFDVADEVETIRVVIIQPRQDTPIRQHTIDPLDLFDFEQDVIRTATVAFGDNPPFNPGDHCRWCKAASGCPAQLDQARSLAVDDFGQETAVAVPEKGMTPDAVGAALTLAYRMAAWAKAVIDFAEEEATHGRNPTGFDFVPTRPTKKWKDEAAAINWLKSSQISEKVYLNSPSLRTPIQVRSEIERSVLPDELSDFDALYSSVSGGRKLVPVKPGSAKQSETVALEELSGEIDFLS